MLLLPVVFVVILYRYPAGLLVYWITTNLWTVGQQSILGDGCRHREQPIAGQLTGSPAARCARRSPTPPVARGGARVQRRAGGGSLPASLPRHLRDHRARRRNAQGEGDERRPTT